MYRERKSMIDEEDCIAWNQGVVEESQVSLLWSFSNHKKNDETDKNAWANKPSGTD